MPSRLVLLLTAGLLAVIASPAFAADTVLDFESLAAGTQVKDQFQAQGARFARSSSGATTSVPNVAARNGGSGKALSLYASCGNEFCSNGTHTLDARLDFARKTVSVLVTDDRVSSIPGDFSGAPELVAHRLGGGPDIVVKGTRGAALPYVLSVASPRRTSRSSRSTASRRSTT
jgi:hypothetical protein